MEGATLPATAGDAAGQGWSNSEGEWNLRRGCGQADRFCPRSPDDDPRSEAARLVRVMLTLEGLR